MPLATRTTTAAEPLARATARLRKRVLLIEEAAPGVLTRVAPGIVAAARQLAAAVPGQSVVPSGNGSVRSSIIDETTFSVRWGDRTCRLGNTVTFRLLARLARRPNQLVSL